MQTLQLFTVITSSSQNIVVHQSDTQRSTKSYTGQQLPETVVGFHITQLSDTQEMKQSRLQSLARRGIQVLTHTIAPWSSLFRQIRSTLTT